MLKINLNVKASSEFVAKLMKLSKKNSRAEILRAITKGMIIGLDAKTAGGKAPQPGTAGAENKSDKSDGSDSTGEPPVEEIFEALDENGNVPKRLVTKKNPKDGEAKKAPKIKAADKTAALVKLMRSKLKGRSFANETSLLQFLNTSFTTGEISRVLGPGVNVPNILKAMKQPFIVTDAVKLAVKKNFTDVAMWFDKQADINKESQSSGIDDDKESEPGEDILDELDEASSTAEKKREAKRVKLLAEAKKIIGDKLPAGPGGLITVLKDHGWSINKIANMLGVDWAGVNAVLSGKIYPYIEQAFKRDWAGTTHSEVNTPGSAVGGKVPQPDNAPGSAVAGKEEK